MVYDVRLGDTNGDGAPDIQVAGQESQNVVWYENRLHVASPRIVGVLSRTCGNSGRDNCALEGG